MLSALKTRDNKLFFFAVINLSHPHSRIACGHNNIIIYYYLSLLTLETKLSVHVIKNTITYANMVERAVSCMYSVHVYIYLLAICIYTRQSKLLSQDTY